MKLSDDYHWEVDYFPSAAPTPTRIVLFPFRPQSSHDYKRHALYLAIITFIKQVIVHIIVAIYNHSACPLTEKPQRPEDFPMLETLPPTVSLETPFINILTENFPVNVYVYLGYDRKR